MIEVKKKLKVDAEAFFQLLEDSLRYDVEHNASKKVDTKKIGKGFKYSRKYQQGKHIINGTIVLMEFERPYRYKSKITTQYGSNIMSYKITSLPKGIQVTYSEEAFDKDGNPEKKKDFLRFLNTRKLKKQFKEMEREILSNKEE